MKRRSTKKATEKAEGGAEVSKSRQISKEEKSKTPRTKAARTKPTAKLEPVVEAQPSSTPKKEKPSTASKEVEAKASQAESTPGRPAASEAKIPSESQSAPKAHPPGVPATKSPPTETRQLYGRDRGGVAKAALPVASSAGAKPSLPAGFKLPVPSILLEGDEPEPPAKTGPGEKFAVGGGPTRETLPGAAQLPPSYGTGRVKVIARDPYCLFVSWDFTATQQRYFNSLSADKHLVLRAHLDSLHGPIAAEAHLHEETRYWFLQVPRAGARYVVEIGYYLPDGAWITVRTAEPVSTQPDRPSEDQTVRFAYAGAVAPAGASGDAGLPERSAPAEFHRTVQTPVLPESRPAVEYPRWTAAQEEALAELISTMIRREQVPGSIEILELLQRQARRPIPLEQEIGIFGPSSAALGISSLPQEQVPSSWGERLPPRKGFWFNVNAELIIYGATEPDAQVTIGGRAIKLRPDGTFSYRFALPDGYFELPAQATSADQTDARRAELRFSRHTRYDGEVGAHPQDKALKPPAPENVA